MARAPLVLAGLLGHGLLSCEGLSTGLVAAGESAGRESMEEFNPKDVWKKLTMLEEVPQTEQCGDAQPGDKCYQLVTWSLDRGLTDHPEWFVTFKKSVFKDRDFKAIQEILYSKGKAGCMKPCPTIVPKKAHKRSAAQLAQAAQAEKAQKEADAQAQKEAEEAAEKQAQARNAAEDKAREAKEAQARVEEKAEQEAEDHAKAAEAQALKVAETQAEIDKVKAELAALSGMDTSEAPSLEALKAEKSQHLEGLQAHLHVEMNQEASKKEAAEKARHAAEELVGKDAEAEAPAQKEAERNMDDLLSEYHQYKDEEKKEAAKEAKLVADKLVGNDVEAEARAQKDADEKEGWTKAPEEADILEDMSPDQLKEYINHPEAIQQLLSSTERRRVEQE